MEIKLNSLTMASQRGFEIFENKGGGVTLWQEDDGGTRNEIVLSANEASVLYNFLGKYINNCDLDHLIKIEEGNKEEAE